LLKVIGKHSTTHLMQTGVIVIVRSFTAIAGRVEAGVTPKIRKNEKSVAWCSSHNFLFFFSFPDPTLEVHFETSR